MSQSNNSIPSSVVSPASALSKPPRLAILIATGFGLGYLPKAPGTWGSLLGVFAANAAPFAITMALNRVHGGGHPGWEPYIWVAILLVFLVGSFGTWASTTIARHSSTKDPQSVVIDEVSGQLVALLPASLETSINVFYTGIAFGWYPYWKYSLAGFILFRVFDIWKPWPVRQAEKLPGGWGIMADDWVAGIYAALCLWGLRVAGL